MLRPSTSERWLRDWLYPQMTLTRSELSTLLIAARMNLWKTYSKPSEHVTKYKQTSPVLWLLPAN